MLGSWRRATACDGTVPGGGATMHRRHTVVALAVATLPAHGVSRQPAEPVQRPASGRELVLPELHRTSLTVRRPGRYAVAAAEAAPVRVPLAGVSSAVSGLAMFSSD
jgi:hypothetical protein